MNTIQSDPSRGKMPVNQGREVLAVDPAQDELPSTFSSGPVPKLIPEPGFMIPRVHQGGAFAQATDTDGDKEEPTLNQCINGWRPSECIFDWAARTYTCTTDLVRCDDRPTDEPIDPGIDPKDPPRDLLQRDNGLEPMSK